MSSARVGRETFFPSPEASLSKSTNFSNVPMSFISSMLATAPGLRVSEMAITPDQKAIVQAAYAPAGGLPFENYARDFVYSIPGATPEAGLPFERATVTAARWKNRLCRRRNIRFKTTISFWWYRKSI